MLSDAERRHLPRKPAIMVEAISSVMSGSFAPTMDGRCPRRRTPCGSPTAPRSRSPRAAAAREDSRQTSARGGQAAIDCRKCVQDRGSEEAISRVDALDIDKPPDEANVGAPSRNTSIGTGDAITPARRRSNRRRLSCIISRTVHAGDRSRPAEFDAINCRRQRGASLAADPAHPGIRASPADGRGDAHQHARKWDVPRRRSDLYDSKRWPQPRAEWGWR